MVAGDEGYRTPENVYFANAVYPFPFSSIVVNSGQSGITKIEPESEGCSLERVVSVSSAISLEEEIIARICAGEKACFHSFTSA
jgi:hypothetical protein